MHRRYGVRALALLIFLCLASPAIAQVDTLRGDVEMADSTEFQMTKSPTLALLMSAVVPGAGQVYNGEWWKVPILYALLGGFGYGAYEQNQRYQEAVGNLNIALAEGNAGDEVRWRRSRDFYRDDRDKWIVYMGLTYVANLIDAYISAHLFDFDVSDPAPMPAGISPMRVGVRIPF
jgi:hypothetical protein